MTKPGEHEAQGWTVRILDHSGASEDDIVENIPRFIDLAHANAFARAYVRDSIERGRLRGASPRDVIENWYSFGENAIVLDAGEAGWRSAVELDEFASTPASPMECNWRALDPRRLVEEDDDFLPSGET